MVAVKRHARAGFTLVEILVVLAIIGVLGSVAMFALGGDPSRSTRYEAERLADVLQLAADEAMYRNMEIGVSATKDSYGFLYYDADAGKWLPLQDRSFRVRTLPDGLTLALRVERDPVELPKTATGVPSVIFYSDGGVPPFVFAVSGSSESYAVGTDGVARIRLLERSTP